MKTQQEIKEQIVKEMQELGINPIPDLETMEVLDVTDFTFEKRQAYYINLMKIEAGRLFEEAIKSLKLEKK